MRVYIAGSSLDLDRVKRWRDELVQAGAIVVSTWVDNVEAVGQGNPRDAAHNLRRKWSIADLEELHNADVLWFLVPAAEIGTRGAWIELGAAFAADMRVVCSGDTKQSIFCSLGEEYANDVAAFEMIKASIERRVS